MGVRLPPEYQEVEYIQSAKGDSQLIDTGIPITYSLVMEITFAVVSVVANYYIMGEYSNNNGTFYLYTTTNYATTKFQTSYGCPYANTTVDVDTEKHTFRYSFDNVKTIVSENGQQILVRPKISPLATSNSIKIAGSRIRNQLSCKTYSFVAYDNGVKVADFVPCYRKADDKPGMYDLVTETFLVNQGTGKDFTVGPNVIDSISPWLVARRRALMLKPVIVPSDWTVVNKLISLGTNTLFPYIDTNIIPNSDYGFDITCETYSNIGGGNFGGIFGGRLSSGNKDFQLTTFCYSTADGGKMRWGDANLNQLNGNLTKGIKTRVVMDSNKYYVDGVEIGTLRSSSSGEANIYLFGLNSNGVPVQHGLGCAIYNAKFFDDNGTLIRNYVPVVRKADDKPGLYDTVGKQFYVNASQTSVEFTWE